MLTILAVNISHPRLDAFWRNVRRPSMSFGAQKLGSGWARIEAALLLREKRQDSAATSATAASAAQTHREPHEWCASMHETSESQSTLWVCVCCQAATHTLKLETGLALRRVSVTSRGSRVCSSDVRGLRQPLVRCKPVVAIYKQFELFAAEKPVDLTTSQPSKWQSDFVATHTQTIEQQ